MNRRGFLAMLGMAPAAAAAAILPETSIVRTAGALKGETIIRIRDLCGGRELTFDLSSRTLRRAAPLAAARKDSLKTLAELGEALPAFGEHLRNPGASIVLGSPMVGESGRAGR